MNIIQNIVTKNPCYKTGKKITVKGLMLHSVGCNQPKASVFINQWNQTNPATAVCPHAVIDGNTGDVHQTLPWNHYGYHAGGSANATHIGVEMGEPACIKYKKNSSVFTCSDLTTARKVAQRTYDTAVQLFAHLCKLYNLDPLANGVISHNEGGKKGVASGHVDPEHLWAGLNMNYTMDGFRKAVKTAMGGTTAEATSDVLYRVQVGAFSKKSNADAMLAKLKTAGFTGYIVGTEKTVEKPEIKVGSTVRVKNGAKTYTGGSLADFVYQRDHIVKQLDGDRAVITYGGAVVAAVNKSDLILV